MKAVIFDMDGVLIDSEPLQVLSEKIVFERYGVKIRDEDWSKFKGRTARDIAQYIIDHYKVCGVTADQIAEEKIKIYLQLANEKIRLFDYALELLNNLCRSYRLALTTSSRRLSQDFIFNKFDLHKFFNVVVTGDMILRGKPDPEPYFKTIELLKLKPAECAVVEDSDNGVISAKQAGAKVIAVTHTFPRERLAAADFIVDNLRQVEDALLNF